MYKAIFIDIDGTLKDSKGNINQRTINAIKKVTQKGILVVICTGRPRGYTQDISENCFASKYVISSNGGNIYDYGEKNSIYSNSMNRKVCMQLFNIAKKSDVRFIMQFGKTKLGAKTEIEVDKTFRDKDIERIVEENDIVQCVILDDNYEKVKNTKPRIIDIENVKINQQHESLIDENVSKDGLIYFDIANVDTTKGNGIEKFCELLNIELKDTIAIGDDYNDITMFKKVGYSVAMGNASKEVKKHASEVTLSNNNDFNT